MLDLLSKGPCEFVAIAVQDFVMRSLIFEGIHSNSVVSIDELDLHAAVGVIPAGKTAACEDLTGEDSGAPGHSRHTQVQAQCVGTVLTFWSKQVLMHRP